MREKTPPSMPVVTIREGEEYAVKELLGIVQDQIEERSVVVIVSNRDSAIWRNARVKTVLPENQLKYVDVEEMRVVTNNRCIAKQIEKDKAENVVVDGSRIGEFGKVGREQNLKSAVMNGVKIGKLENYMIDEEMRSQSEESLCKSIMKGLTRRNREKHAMLAEVEEKEQDVIYFDDITGKELLWHALRQARELELKYLRDLGVYDKIDENEAVCTIQNHSSRHVISGHKQIIFRSPCRDFSFGGV